MLGLISTIYILIILWAKAIKLFMESVMNYRFSGIKKLEGGALLTFCQILPNATPSNSTHTMY